MMLNLEYYKKDINYDRLLTLEYENEIKQKYFNSENVLILDEKFQNEFETEKISHLLSVEKNILQWYEFKENATVLEIGAKLGGITSLLSEKCKEVTSIEFSKQRGEIISKRLKNNKNIEVIIGNLQDINLEDKKFDYVVLIGILEYAPLFFKSENPYLDFLSFAKSKLKPNGKILLAIDNPLGVQYIVGNKCELNIQAFETLENNNNPKLLNKNDIENILRTLEIDNFKFYYPLPNYKFTNVIFSDEYLPISNDTKIMYNLIYNNNSKILLDERKVMKNFISAGMFENVANSYFVEISLDGQLQKSKFISYNLLRNKKYNLMTTLDNKLAIKRGVDLEASSHIKNISKNIEELNKYGINIIDKYEEDKIVSEIFNKEQFDQYLIRLYNEFKIDQFYDEIENWYNHLKNKLLNEENLIKTEKNLNFLKKCYIDLVFENTFFDNEKYYFFDQEWILEECPLEYILYRALKNLISYNDLNIDFDYLLNRFKILEFKNEFQKYEEKLQEQVNDNYMVKLFSRAYTFKKDIGKFENIDILKKEIEDKEHKIQQILEENCEIKLKINDIAEKEKKLQKEKEKIIDELSKEHLKAEQLEECKNKLEEELKNKNYENLSMIEIFKRKINNKIKKEE